MNAYFSMKLDGGYGSVSGIYESVTSDKTPQSFQNWVYIVQIYQPAAYVIEYIKAELANRSFWYLSGIW